MNVIKMIAGDTPKQAWQRLLLYILFICLYLDLGGALGVRFIALVIIFGSLLFHPPALLNALKSPFVFAIFLIWPFIAATIGIAGGADLALAFQNSVALLSFPVLVAFFSIFQLKDSLWAIQRAALTAAVVTCVFWLAILMNSFSALAMAEKLSEMEVGFFGLRELGGLSFSVVYFKATLFYVSAGVLLIAEKRYWALSLVLLALMAAMSKTGVMVIFVVLFARVFKSRPILMVTLMTIGSLIVLAGADYSAILNVFTALSGDTNTVDVRLDHWDSLVSFFEENPISFIFGQGAGTMFYSVAAGEYVNNIELDHLNSIRKFGVIWFGVFSLFVGYVSYALFKGNEKWLSMALVITFIICGTNPVLLTLLFMSILSICYVAVSQSRYSKLSAASNCGIV